ncbi:MAG: NPXTG-anchored protein [Oscillospiraceae bacterium]|nr:NPXTG-anchored protein [Oscillospiraceae bacterium]
MKFRKIFAALAAATMAITMTVSASAENLSEVMKPEDEGYYSIGAMGYFMSQEYNWNQGDWAGIDADGKISMTYNINEVFAGPIGSGTLGEMGIMVCNLPADVELEVAVLSATFTPKGSDEAIDLTSILNGRTLIHPTGEEAPRFYVRPLADEETGKVATPEVEGWDVAGAFKGGELKIELSFNDADIAARPELPKEEEKPVETPDDNTDTGLGSIALVGLAVSAAGAVASKKRK